MAINLFDENYIFFFVLHFRRASKTSKDVCGKLRVVWNCGTLAQTHNENSVSEEKVAWMLPNNITHALHPATSKRG